MKKAFTLMEIMIVVTLLVILAILALITLNPKKQIEKSQDSKRKTELTQLQKVLEDWYNDKNCYPKPEQICYDTAEATQSETYICHICGNQTPIRDFNPYINRLPCDPEQPIKKYLYEVDDLNCPKKYWIYTKLSNKIDPIIGQLGCKNGCGPYGDLNYNFGVFSPGEGPQLGFGGEIEPSSTPTPTPITVGKCSLFTTIFISIEPGVCNVCGTYQECKQNYPNLTYYVDYLCTQACIKD